MFRKFRDKNLDLKDAPHSGRLVTTDFSQIKALIESNRHITTRDIVKMLEISAMMVSRHILKWRIKWKEFDRQDCDELSKRNESDPFLKRLVTGEKWIVYNITRKASWSGSAEPTQVELHSKKFMLCVGDWKGILYYELLPHN